MGVRSSTPPWAVEDHEAADVPTMVTDEELRYLHWLTRTQWDGRTDVVEVGPFLGATTRALAGGMAAHPSRSLDARLHVIDAFVWRPFMAAPGRPELQPGASSRTAFEQNLRTREELLVVHQAQLPDEPHLDVEFDEPPSDESSGVASFDASVFARDVGIVFIDGAKSWRALVAFLRGTAPRLVSQEALLVLQDLKAWAAWWVPAVVGP